eukprot:6755088-Alexandrium_andersonii.AAC.1
MPRTVDCRSRRIAGADRPREDCGLLLGHLYSVTIPGRGRGASQESGWLHAVVLPAQPRAGLG